MDIGTVAEFVADEAIARAAVNAGVDALQGYAVQPPLPLADALAWCRSAEAARWGSYDNPLADQVIA
jgi:EAL domain-containing protein (putative c-di-GMP-specific phosphodiesterase class I)